jgi:hypothetical protein
MASLSSAALLFAKMTFSRSFLGGPNWSSGCGGGSVSRQAPGQTSIADLNAHHLYGPSAGDGDDLLLLGCEAFPDERRDHGPIESMDQDEQFLCDAVRSAPPRPFLCG